MKEIYKQRKKYNKIVTDCVNERMDGWMKGRETDEQDPTLCPSLSCRYLTFSSTLTVITVWSAVA